MSEILEEVQNYLVTKVASINPNNPAANSGAVTLRFSSNWPDESLMCTYIALSTLQSQFTRDTVACPAGKAMLTATATSIGER